MTLRVRSSIARSTATDISELLNNNQDPDSMMLSAKRSVSADIDNINNQHLNKNNDDHNGHLLISDDEDLDLDNNTPYHIQSYDDNDMTEDYVNVNSKYYPNTNNNSYFEPFVNSGQQSINNSNGVSSSSRNEKCMRAILQLTFLISVIFFISPLIFFIAGASQIIEEYARISVAVREHNDSDDTHVKDFWHFPTIHNICTQGQGANHYCIRYIFFLIYMIIFTIMFVCCVSLFAIRKDKHPLKSRSCVFITIFCISLPFYMIWSCIGLLYSPSWLGCHATHIFNNIMYPLLILPYFFRAFRIKKIYDEATTTHDKYNRDMMNIFRSARAQSILSGNVNNNYIEETKSNSAHNNNGNVSQHHTIQSIRSMERTSTPKGTPKIGDKQRSNSILSHANDSSFNFQDAMSYSKQLDKKLIKRFILCLIPFLIISITNYLTSKNHLLPTFIKSCDDYNPSSAIFVWVIIHAIEIFILILIVYWIRLVWRAFSVKQELMIVTVIDMVFCACMIGFNPTTDSIDDGVLINYLILMRGIGFFMISILLPLYKTYTFITWIPEIPTQDVITSLQAILDDMDACVYFRQFMTEQDSQYLLDFWMEIDLFKDACYNQEIDDIYFAASKIFKKYFHSDNHSKAATSVRYIINSKEKITSTTHKSNKKTYCKAINKMFDENNHRKAEIHPNIFDHPHRVIFEHMENTHYRLFLRSQYCKQLLAAVAGQEEIFRKLINQEIL